MNTEQNNIIAGLDIGTTKICVIVGQLADNNKINILGVGKASSQGGVSRGMVANVSKVVEGIKEAVAQAEKVSGVKINTVYAGIAGHHIRSLQHRGNLTRQNGDEEILASELLKLEEEMQNLVIQPGLEILHVLPQEYTIDNEKGIRDPAGRIGVRVECNFHIITGETSRANIILRSVQNAGLGVADLVVEPVASSTAVLSPEEMEAGVVLVDIGGGTSDVCVFENGYITHTAIIPMGGDRITQDLQEAFGILKEQAEEVKVKYGSCYPTDSMKNEVVVVPGLPGRQPKEISLYAIAQVIRARMEDIVQKVDFEIQLSGVSGMLNGGIVLTGGGSGLKEVRNLFSWGTGFDVHINSPGKHLGMGMIEEVRSPMYSTSIGLVMKGIEIEHRQGTECVPNKFIQESPKQESEEPVLEEVIDESSTENKPKLPNWGSKRYKGVKFFGEIINKYLADDSEDFA
jgi:cell division protein FtsA